MRLVAVAAAAALALASPSALAEEASANGEVSGDPLPSPPAAAAAAGGSPELGPGPAPTPPAPPSAPGTSPQPSPGGAPPRETSQWGVLADAGLPQGATLSAAYRPVPSLRIFAGPAWSYLAFGLQGGVSFAPWRLAVTPVLTVEAGRYFGANASFLARGGVPTELSTLMKDMSYTYGAIHAGIEFGSQNGFSFALALGLGYVALDATGTVTKTDSSGSTVTFQDPRFRGTLPSLKLGLHYWF